MEEAPGNDRESLHSAHANGMNEWKLIEHSGAHVTPRLYENCVVLFRAVLYSCRRICVWSCTEGNDRVNPFLATYIIICSNVGICCYLLTGVMMYH